MKRNMQLESNRSLWNKLASIHPGTKFYNNEGFLEGRDSLTEIEQEMMGEVAGKKILHLQCHFGQDSLSLARKGAIVTGVDFSEVAIQKAKSLAVKLSLNANFVCCDVNELDQHLDEKFDIVFASFGVIGWHSNLAHWSGIVAHFLKDGGRLCFAEFHPVLWMLSDNHKSFEYSYFKQDVIIGENEGSYADPNAKELGTSYCWNHSLSEFFQSLESNGLIVRNFREFDYSPYACFSNAVGEDERFQIKGLEKTLPLTYSLTAYKR